MVDRLKTHYFSVQVELLERIKHDAGGKLVEVGVSYVRRESGESKFKITQALKDATVLLKSAKERRIQTI